MNTWNMLGLLAICLTLVCAFDERRVVAAETEAESDSDFGGAFGINGVGAFHQRHALQGDVLRRIANLKQLGVRWDRSDFWWHVLEPREGEFDWTFSDALLDIYDEHDLQLFPILCYSSAWARGDGYAPSNELEWKQFATFTFEAVNSYKDRIRYWEIWNEPNILPFWRPQPSVEDYVRLLKEAYIAAKQADPDCVIVGMCTAGFDLKFIERAYQLGAKDYFDVMSCHYYLTAAPEDGIKRELQNLRHLMTRYGDGDKKVWITEMGVTSHPSQKHGVSERQQANLLVRNHLANLASGLVEKIFWFCLIDWTDNPDYERWDSYLGLLRYNRSEKPSFDAYKNLVIWLDGAEYVGDPQIDKEVYSWLWRKGSDLILIACAKQEPVELSLPAASTTIQQHGLYGDKHAIQALEDGLAQTVLEETPTCFVGVSESLLYRASFGFRPDSLTMQPGEATSVQLAFQNPFSEKIKASLSVQLPQGWKVRHSRTVTLQPNAERTIRFHIQAPSDAPTRDHTIVATLEFQKGTTEADALQFSSLPLESSLRVAITELVSLRIRPLVDGDEFVTTLEIASHMTTPLRSTLRMDFPWESENAKKTIPIGEQVKWICRHSISGIRNMESSEPIVASAGIRGMPQTVEKHFNLGTIPLVQEPSWLKGEATAKPTVTLLQRHALTQVGIDSDFSSDVWLAFSNKSLFVRTTFHDATPAQNPFDGEEIWKGDCLELYLGFAGPEEQPYFSARDFQVLISPGNDGENAQIFSFPQKRKVTEAHLSVAPLESGYEMQVEIPLSLFGEQGVQPGQLIGLDVSAHDYNHKHPEQMQALMWNGTGANWLTPRDWGIGVITKP